MQCRAGTCSPHVGGMAPPMGHTGSARMPPRLQLVRGGPARAPRGPTPPAPPSAHSVEARRLVDGWLATSFIGKGDAVDDLVGRIAAVLAARDAHLDTSAPVSDRPLC